MRKNILIMTASGAYNLGDELILQSEILYLSERFPESHIIVFTYDRRSLIGDRQSVTAILSYFPSHIKKHPFRNILYFFQNLIALMRSDLLVVGGGGIFFDSEPGISFHKILWQWWSRITIARIFGSHIVFLGISLEIRKEKHLKYLKKLFRASDTVLCRDVRSTKMLESIGVEAETISDLAWLIPSFGGTKNPGFRNNRSFLSSGGRKQQKQGNKLQRVGIALRPGFDFASSHIIAMIEFLKTKGYEIVFLSHSLHPDREHNDRVFVEKIVHSAQKTVYTMESICITKTLQETLEAYETLDIVIGMRFHSVVLAALHSIPCIPISYSQKTKMLATELGIAEQMLEASQFDIMDFAKIWQNVEKHSETQKIALGKRSREIGEKLLQDLGNTDILGISN